MLSRLRSVALHRVPLCTAAVQCTVPGTAVPFAAALLLLPVSPPFKPATIAPSWRLLVLMLLYGVSLTPLFPLPCACTAVAGITPEGVQRRVVEVLEGLSAPPPPPANRASSSAGTTVAAQAPGGIAKVGISVASERRVASKAHDAGMSVARISGWLLGVPVLLGLLTCWCCCCCCCTAGPRVASRTSQSSGPSTPTSGIPPALPFSAPPAAMFAGAGAGQQAYGSGGSTSGGSSSGSGAARRTLFNSGSGNASGGLAVQGAAAGAGSPGSPTLSGGSSRRRSTATALAGSGRGGPGSPAASGSCSPAAGGGGSHAGGAGAFGGIGSVSGSDRRLSGAACPAGPPGPMSPELQEAVEQVRARGVTGCRGQHST